MPLTRRHFELAITPEIERWMRNIYKFLAENKDLAYSFDEIVSELGKGLISGTLRIGADVADGVDETTLKRAVEALAELGAIEAREVGGKIYFALVQEFDTDTWQQKVFKVG